MKQLKYYMYFILKEWNAICVLYFKKYIVSWINNVEAAFSISSTLRRPSTYPPLKSHAST